jgi:signal transduction histidine kinase
VKGTGSDAPDAGVAVADVRRLASDVVAMSTLSAVWAGSSRPQIAASLAEVIHQTLNADVVCVTLHGTAGASECRRFWPADAVDADLETPNPLVTPIGIAAEHGAIVTVSRQVTFPSDLHRLILNVAANQATVALLAGTAREEQRISETLQRVGTSVVAELDPEKVVQTVTDEATALTGADFGAFFYNVVDASGESYMLYTLAGAPLEAFSRFPMPRNTAIFGPTFAGTEVVRLADVTADPRFGRSAPYYGMPPGHLPVRSYLAVPVLSRTGKVHGGLFFGHKDVGVFTERHERLARGLAAWAALAMDNGYLYAEAQRANMAKDDFLATLSHELRTPMNAIVGWLSMLRRPEVMSAAGIPKAWAAIDRNTEALTGLIEDLLDVSRIASGKIRLAATDADMHDIVRDSVRTMEPKFREKQVTMSLDARERPCTVRGDVARLRQVVVNLLSNAVKFTSSAGHVEVRLGREENSVVLSVADNGIGIHPDFLPHVFERFRQSSADTTMGLGLGLAIVQNLVELHGGSVVAASDGLGRGSRFTVTLPRG